MRGLQENLVSFDLNPGPAEGILGPKTERSVKALRRSEGPEADGIVVPLTRAAIAAEKKAARQISDPGSRTA